MSFSIHMGNGDGLNSRPVKPSGNGANLLLLGSVLFVAFCAFDYSPYGTGLVSVALGDAKRWVQYAVWSLKIAGS